MIFAILLPVLVGFAAIVVDLGHMWQVRGQLQNAADAAALAGVRDLNGKAEGLTAARASAQVYAALHKANTTPVTLSPNMANDATGEIVLGHWDFTARTFTPMPPSTLPTSIFNAVQTTAHRDGTSGGPVQTFLAGIFGRSTMDVKASSIAVAGFPSQACAFPVAVASCALRDSSGNFVCPGVLSFGGSNPIDKNVGITTLATGDPPNGNNIIPLVKQALAGTCGTNNVTTSDSIPVQNGNDLSKTSVNDIKAAVAKGPPVYVDLAVVDYPDCSNVIMNQTKKIVGFLRVQLTGANFPNPKAIYMTGACGQLTSAPIGGGDFGLRSTQVRLVK